MTSTKMYMEMELLEGQTLQGCTCNIDIHGHTHVWISDLGHAMDASTDV